MTLSEFEIKIATIAALYGFDYIGYSSFDDGEFNEEYSSLSGYLLFMGGEMKLVIDVSSSVDQVHGQFKNYRIKLDEISINRCAEVSDASKF